MAVSPGCAGQVPLKSSAATMMGKTITLHVLAPTLGRSATL